MTYSKHYTVSPQGADLRIPDDAVIVKVDAQYGTWHVWFLLPKDDLDGGAA
jgi:hypothetical protein